MINDDDLGPIFFVIIWTALFIYISLPKFFGWGHLNPSEI